METKSLYVHFPFCEAKCHYCDFYSLGKSRTRPEDSITFESALKTEVRLNRSKFSPTLDTIFFGGGTPSMTSPAFMADLRQELTQYTKIPDGAEWTMEANPSSVYLESLKEYRALGVNRISMGVQAMKDSLLTILGRVHSQNDALRALENIFEAGFSNVSTDLLCGVPQQSVQDIEAALNQLTKFPITHLSCYLLTLPPHHAMYKELPNESIQLEHLQFVDLWMTQNGFEHYEISNYARPGHRSRHNLNYWNNNSYLGLGPSAHSFDAKTRTRWKNFSSIHKYAQHLTENKLPIEWTENLSEDQKELEKWMLALRLSDGFPFTWLDTQTRKLKSQILKNNGLLEVHPLYVDRMRLTSKGFALSDQVISELA